MFYHLSPTRPHRYTGKSTLCGIADSLQVLDQLTALLPVEARERIKKFRLPNDCLRE